ncbi:LuxR C-terminal-related transcriptional regulator [Streptomyces sp. NPDC054841]
MSDGTETTDAHGPTRLSDAARALYERGRLEQGNLHADPGEPGLDELLESGFAIPNIWGENQYLLQGPHQVWRGRVHREVESIGEAVRRIQRLGDLVDTMPDWAVAGESGLQFLDNVDLANAEIQRALNEARTEVWTSHPHDRDEKTMTESLPGDLKRLDRGIGLRTIYLDRARSRKVQADWAAEVTRHGAEVRTLPGGFFRVVGVDDAFAVIPDHRPGRLSRTTAWKVTNPGMVAALREFYSQQWSQAEPWMGGHVRPTQDTVTTAMQRRILRDMSAGKSQSQIADRLRVNVKTVQNHLRPLYDTLGIASGDAFRLGEFWRDTEERFLP